MEYGQIFLILAVLFGFFMAWGVGANDVANAMGTSVGSRALTLRQAVIIAAIFEASGALLAGGQVTRTIGSQLIDTHLLLNSPDILIFGMLAALLSSGTWLLTASYFGWPVSTTHSIIGAVVGFGSVVLGVHAVNWHVVINIGLSWLVTPLISGVLAYLLFRSVQKFIFNSASPFKSAKRLIPWYLFLVSLVISTVTLTKGVKHLGMHLSTIQGVISAVVISMVIMLMGKLALRGVHIEPNANHKLLFLRIEQMFGILMVFTACAMAFAHGTNDVANAIGPLAAIVSIVKSGGVITAFSPIPFWVMALGAVGIVLGLATYGHRVIATIGTNITDLTPTRGFAAELATASTVVIASGFGLPISTTQTLVGAVLGVGFARGIGALNLSVIRNIFMSWIITLPAGALLAIGYFYAIKSFFN